MQKNRSLKQVGQILTILSETYPEAKSGLVYDGPFQLLIATILSAQCTDKRVNMVARRLFNRCRGPEEFLSLSREELEHEIQECGLFREKAKNIHQTCCLLLRHHHGNVPGSLEELIRLPGVGRKTANVVLSNAFGIPAIAVDTHVHRVSGRLGLIEEKCNPFQAEKQLMKKIPRKLWTPAHHWLIHHGRQVCTARSPQCEQCLLRKHCPSSRLN